MNAITKSAGVASTELTVPAPHSGASLYRVSTDAAEICRAIVVATAKQIGDRQYVQVEGWQAIAVAHGCAASSGDVVRHPDGSVSAVGRIVRIDTGAIIASAEGYVGADEPTWFGGTVLKWKWGEKRGEKVWYEQEMPKRADYAIRAMAQTRAISRACRSAFAHVVVMMNAGLSTTPAEEVPEGGFYDAPPSPPEAARPPAASHAINDAVPMPRTATPPAPRKADPLAALDEPDGPQWLRNLETLLANAQSQQEVVDIAEHVSVGNAASKAPAAIRNRISELLASAYKRFAEPEDPELAIVGAENIGAG
jgi:hypothetical protein